MLKSPLKISIDDIAIENMIFHIKINNDIYKIRCTDMPFEEFSKRIPTEKDRTRFAHYILTSNYSGVIGWNADGNKFLYSEIHEWLNPVYALYDPDPNSSIKINNFCSLERIQWHFLCHCILDYWAGNGFISGIIAPDEMETIWGHFLSEAKCKILNVDFPRLSTESRKIELGLIRSESENKSVCVNCIKNQGAETFIRCSSLFQEYRQKYLIKMSEWIKEVIRDQKNYEFYKSSKDSLPGNTSSRRHIHLAERGENSIHAFAIQRNNDGEFNICLILFNEEKSSRKSYTIKTSYHLKTCKTRRNMDYFFRHELLSRRKYQNKTVIDKCHITNWS